MALHETLTAFVDLRFRTGGGGGTAFSISQKKSTAVAKEKGHDCIFPSSLLKHCTATAKIPVGFFRFFPSFPIAPDRKIIKSKPMKGVNN